MQRYGRRDALPQNLARPNLVGTCAAAASMVKASVVKTR